MNDARKTVQGITLYQQARKAHDAGELRVAADGYQKALALCPAHPGLTADFARLATDAKDWPAAEKLYRHLLSIKPDCRCEPLLAQALVRQDQFATALPLLRQHLQYQPDNPDVLLMAGLCASKLKYWAEAVELGQQLDRVRSSPKSLDLIINGLFNLGRKTELDALIDEVMARYPDNPELLGLAGVHLLKRGEFARGFALQLAIRWRYDQRRPADFRTLPADFWDGQKFAGTLLVAGEQGLGEEILSSGMLTDLVTMQQPAVVECEPRLLPLFRRSWPTLEFRPRHAGELDRLIASGITYRRINGLDLAYFLRRQHPLPPQPPWLLADHDRSSELRARYQARFPGKRLVALSWRSHRAFHNGPDKSVPIQALVPLLQRADCAFIDVQYGDVDAELAVLDAAGVARPWRDPELNATTDIDGLAAQLAAMDAVVSVSNTTIHLAGALGVPGLLLLPKTRPVLWYWGYEADVTPWYPSLQLLRNHSEQDWQELIARAGVALDRLPARTEPAR